MLRSIPYESESNPNNFESHSSSDLRWIGSALMLLCHRKTASVERDQRLCRSGVSSIYARRHGQPFGTSLPDAARWRCREGGRANGHARPGYLCRQRMVGQERKILGTTVVHSTVPRIRQSSQNDGGGCRWAIQILRAGTGKILCAHGGDLGSGRLHTYSRWIGWAVGRSKGRPTD